MRSARSVRLLVRILPIIVTVGFATCVLLSTEVRAAQPSYVTVAGSLQTEAGCSGDWDPSCPNTHMTYDAGDDVWQKSLSLPAGSFEYLVALDNDWTEHYGAHAQAGGANIPLNLGSSAIVKFYYDNKTHWATDNHNSVIVIAGGSFQSELGCPGDWDPGCLRSWLQDADGDGKYTMTTTSLPPGSYETKAAIDESWDENYGLGGVPGGANITFVVSTPGQMITFEYVAATHVLTIKGATEPPTSTPTPTKTVVSTATPVTPSATTTNPSPTFEVPEIPTFVPPELPEIPNPSSSHKVRLIELARDAANQGR